MKRISRMLLLLFFLAPLSALADSINTSNLELILGIGPNVFGDNLGGILYNPQINLFVGGGTPADWFGINGYAPGSVGGGNTTIFFDSVGGNIGAYNAINIEAAGLFVSTFTFPTNGEQDFTVKLPALITTIPVFACDNNGNCQEFFLSPNSGTLTLSFYLSGGLYYANQGSFTTIPEPGTLGLMGVGFAVLWWWKSRQRMRAAQ